MRFSDHQNSVKSFPQSAGNGISETLDFKVFLGGMPPYLRRGLPTSALGSRAFSTRPGHRINTQPEVRLVFSAAAIFLASVHGKCLHYTEDVDVVFTTKSSSLLTLERGR